MTSHSDIGGSSSSSGGEARGRTSDWSDAAGDQSREGAARRGRNSPFGHSGKRWGLRILASLFLFACFGLGAWLYLDTGKRFVWLPPGSYIGSIKGVFAKQGSVPVYVERAPESDEMFVVVLRPGWEPQIRSTVLFSADESGDQASRSYLPLLLSDGEMQLELIGGERDAKGFVGQARNISSNREGSWRLEPLRSPPIDIESNAAEVRRWLMLRAELETGVERLDQLTQRLPAQRAEIEKLSAMLSEGQELRTRANSRFATLRGELEEAQRELEQERKEVRALEEALEVSQKVTPQGRLVGLARESLEREGRIVESMRRAQAGTSTADLEQEFIRAQEALSLQAEISQLRAQRGISQAVEPSAETRGSLRPGSLGGKAARTKADGRASPVRGGVQ